MVIYHFGMFLLFLVLSVLTGYKAIVNIIAEKPALAIIWLMACLFNFSTTILNLVFGINRLIEGDNL